MNSPTQSSLVYHFDRFEALETQCIQTLGRAKALHFVELANDWIDITQAIGRVYNQSVQNQSLVLAFFLFLFKEVQWLHLHFVCRNYPLIGRSLRFL